MSLSKPVITTSHGDVTSSAFSPPPPPPPPLLFLSFLPQLTEESSSRKRSKRQTLVLGDPRTPSAEPPAVATLFSPRKDTVTLVRQAPRPTLAYGDPATLVVERCHDDGGQSQRALFIVGTVGPRVAPNSNIYYGKRQ